ncbi:MAG TPA: 2-oxoglutarate dehydrogenase complex dihydrolipoyllysine-residue succinyltransferase [Terriglobia bacterium]|nr:2-oxoglutarate dehydrogenase complex dihydrolipoyllysine-residue succinyltransferase [Terriglobia bacterium]
MPAKIVVPELGESVLEATVGHWLKNEGDRVNVGEVLVSLETDKVDLEVGAERGGVLARIERHEGEDVKIGDVLGVIEDGAGAAQTNGAGASFKEGEKMAASTAPLVAQPRVDRVVGAHGHVPLQAISPAGAPETAAASEPPATPSARRLARERGVDLETLVPSDGERLTKADVERHLAGSSKPQPKAAARPTTPPAVPQPQPASGASLAATPSPTVPGARLEERVRMSRRRQTIARRLVEAQREAAMLTTFNEVDMSAVMEMRKRHKESFQERYGVGLGISSFFVKAAVAALRAFPRLNAEIDGDDIVLKHYYDIGSAVGAAEGLVVPVLRDADRLTFAEIEKGIKRFAQQARDRTLALDDLRGGTFTITNGGVFGSLMSTPILNPPQVGILGLHKVQERPVSLSGQVVSRPMMYIALSYDHRIVDGMEAVQFLVRVKQLVEEPASLLLEG